jgi:hypothetical protein
MLKATLNHAGCVITTSGVFSFLFLEQLGTSFYQASAQMPPEASYDLDASLKQLEEQASCWIFKKYTMTKH